VAMVRLAGERHLRAAGAKTHRGIARRCRAVGEALPRGF
jgi:hypothetical protein